MRHYAGEKQEHEEEEEEEDDVFDVFNKLSSKGSGRPSRKLNHSVMAADVHAGVSTDTLTTDHDFHVHHKSGRMSHGSKSNHHDTAGSFQQTNRAAKMQALLDQLQQDSSIHRNMDIHDPTRLDPNHMTKKQKAFQTETKETTCTGSSSTTTTTSTSQNYGSHCTSIQEELNTTNLFVGNLSPLVTEQDLWDVFSQCGPLISVKIMWPRKTDYNHMANSSSSISGSGTSSSLHYSSSRDHHSGFVCFVHRTSAQYAMDHYNHFEWKGRRIYLNWGKPVVATATTTVAVEDDDDDDDDDDEKVVLPLPLPLTYDRYTFINTIAIQVARYGSVLEEKLRQEDDEDQCSRTWAFLYPRDTWYPIHSNPNRHNDKNNEDDEDDITQEIHDESLYYRWKVYALTQEQKDPPILERRRRPSLDLSTQGDMTSFTSWSTKPFQMFHHGTYFLPPSYTQVISKYNLVDHNSSLPLPPTPKTTTTTFTADATNTNTTITTFSSKHSVPIQYKTTLEGRIELIEDDIIQFHDIIKHLIASKDSICQAMAFCMDRSMAVVHVSSLLKGALLFESQSHPTGLGVSIDTICARLYLLSDVLYNSQQPGVKNAFQFRTCIEQMAKEVFQSLGRYDANVPVGRMARNKLRNAVRAVLSAWNDWSVFVPEFLDELEALFEGREYSLTQTPHDGTGIIEEKKISMSNNTAGPITDKTNDLIVKDEPPPPPSSIWMDVLGCDTNNTTTGVDEKDIESSTPHPSVDHNPWKMSSYTEDNYLDLIDEELDGESLGESEIDYDGTILASLHDNDSLTATMIE